MPKVYSSCRLGARRWGSELVSYGSALVSGAKGRAELLDCYLRSGVLGYRHFITWAW